MDFQKFKEGIASQEGADLFLFLNQLERKLDKKKENTFIPEENMRYAYKYDKVESSYFFFSYSGEVYNFIGLRPSHDRVEIQVSGGRVLLLETERPESLARAIGIIIMSETEDGSIADIDKGLRMRGYAVTKSERVKGNLPVDILNLPDSEVLVEYEIRKNIVTSRLGVAVGEKLVLCQRGSSQIILVVTSLGVLKLDLMASETLFDKVAELAETHRAKLEFMRV